MSRFLFATFVWGVLIALVASLARWGVPEHLASVLIPATEPAFVPRIPDVPRAKAGDGTPVRPPPLPAPTAPSPTAAANGPRDPRAADGLVVPKAPQLPHTSGTQQGQTTPTTTPQRGSESGIPGLGSLPAGPSAEYQGLGVQVFSRATQKPIAGALVRFALANDLEEWQRTHHGLDPRRADPAQVLESCVRPVLTGTSGVALTDSAPGRMLVDARHGDMYGFAWVDRDQDARARIDLVPDHTLVVSVSDTQGKPVGGVTVLVRDSSCTDLWSATVGSDGHAYWPHASFLMARDASPGPCSVMLERVTDGAGRKVQSPPNPLYWEPTALAAHPTARLVVELRDQSGEWKDELVSFSLSHPGAGACGSRVRVMTATGSASFEVEPGLELVLEIEGGNVFDTTVRELPPLTRAGEVRTVQVAPGPRFPVVRARLTDGNAGSLVGVHGTAWCEVVEGDTRRSVEIRAPFETDAQGRVKMILNFLPAAARCESLLIVTKNEYDDWCNAVRVPFTTLGGEVELGDLVLTEMPTIAAGYVLNEREWPVPGAVVEVSATDDPALSVQAFPPDLRFSAVADQMARFRLRGLVDGARVALTASAVDHVRPTPREIERGERKIALEISRCASISGVMLLPDIPLDKIHVWIDTVDGPIPAAIGPERTYRCVGITPGEIDLRVMVDGIDGPVFLVPRITALAGVELKEPGKTTIDLRTRVSWRTFEVREEGDWGYLSGTATLTETREDMRTVRTIPFTNVLAFTTTAERVDAELVVDGFERLVLPDILRDASLAGALTLTRARR